MKTMLKLVSTVTTLLMPSYLIADQSSLAIIAPESSRNYASYVAEGCIREANKSDDLTCKLILYPGDSAPAQVATVRKAIEAGFDAIAYYSTEPIAAATALELAQDQVPIVTWGTELPTNLQDKHETFVGVNSYERGKQLALLVVKQSVADSTVAVQTNDTQSFMDGFSETLNSASLEKGLSIKLIDEIFGADVHPASIVESYPNISTIVSDVPIASSIADTYFGILDTMRQESPVKFPRIITSDRDQVRFNQYYNGLSTGIVFENPDLVGLQIVKSARDILAEVEVNVQTVAGLEVLSKDEQCCSKDDKSCCPAHTTQFIFRDILKH